MRSVLVLVVVLLVWGVAHAEIPQVISYQGKVTDATGTPLADGPYTMRFRIYDAVNAGTLKWDSNAQTVAVAGGIFSVLLGESPQAALTLAFDQDYWLQVTFGGVDQAPRQRLASSGYAYMASGLVAGTEVSGSINSGTYAAMRGTNTATTGFAFGLSGWTDSNSGSGVWGYASPTTGSPNGVYGWSVSTAGRGVHGYVSASTGTTRGVYGWSQSTGGTGVYGCADTPSGITYGVFGTSESTGGTGVHGSSTATSGITYGVFGRNSSTAGRGVYGEALATSGTTYGGRFRNYSAGGTGVYGSAETTSGTTFGGYFESRSTEGTAVYGVASSTTPSVDRSYGGYFVSASDFATGIYGATTATTENPSYGGYFESASRQGMGVLGKATATTGNTWGGSFVSASTAGRAVSGHATATVGYTWGVIGISSSIDGTGVSGTTSATTGTTYAVYGAAASPDGYAGYFSGRLRASTSINAGATPGNHAGLIYNSSTGTSPDVLALKVGYTGNPGSAINYLTFFNGTDTAVGAVEGDGAGGVTFLSGGGDYAEYLPRLHGVELEPGDVVGVFDGKVSRRTGDVSQIMVVSTRPIVVGNNPGEERASDYVRVAFIGQVEVKVRGPVQAGDLLLPSGMDDGTAVALSRAEISAEQFREVFGQAWEGSADGGVKLVRAAVCLVQHDPNVTRLATENKELREANRTLQAAIVDLQGRVAALEQ